MKPPSLERARVRRSRSQASEESEIGRTEKKKNETVLIGKRPVQHIYPDILYINVYIKAIHVHNHIK